MTGTPGTVAIETERLRLEPLGPDHLDAVHAIYADPATWRHLPSGRFTDLDRTRRLLAASALSRDRFGTGSFAVRVRAGDGSVGPVIGSVGCRMLDLPAWNLGYRFGPTAWGRGYATEAARAAVGDAHRAAPEVPVTARALTTNPASLRVLARVGLTECWRGRSAEAAAEDPSGTAGLLRVVAADRELSTELLDGLIALG